MWLKRLLIRTDETKVQILDFFTEMNYYYYEDESTARIPLISPLSLSLLSLSLLLSIVLGSPQDGTLCPHRADLCKLLPVSQPRSSSENIAFKFVGNAQHILFILLGWLMRLEISGQTVAFFRGCCHDLFKTAQSVLMLFPSRFSFGCFICVQGVQPYSSNDTATVRANISFILTEISDFNMIFYG